MSCWCAAGIAVRACAPVVKKKTTDPAVVVVVDLGQVSISLLSGHLGGANELAKKAAEICHAVPVITTATDGRGLFAVDEFARKNNLWIAEDVYKRQHIWYLIQEQPFWMRWFWRWYQGMRKEPTDTRLLRIYGRPLMFQSRLFILYCAGFKRKSAWKRCV